MERDRNANRQALAAEPKKASLHFRLAQTLEREKTIEALKSYEEASRLAPKTSGPGLRLPG